MHWKASENQLYNSRGSRSPNQETFRNYLQHVIGACFYTGNAEWKCFLSQLIDLPLQSKVFIHCGGVGLSLQNSGHSLYHCPCRVWQINEYRALVELHWQGIAWALRDNLTHSQCWTVFYTNLTWTTPGLDIDSELKVHRLMSMVKSYIVR